MELTGHVRSVATTLRKLEKAYVEWDFVTFERAARSLKQTMDQVVEEWERSLADVESDLDANVQHVETDAYGQSVEQALRDEGLSFEGEYPKYDLPPFKLEVDVKAKCIRLRFGHRRKTTTCFLPSVMARWVAVRYKRVVESTFDAKRLSRDLLAAYEVANRLTYRTEKVLWARPVFLKNVYELLTLRHGSQGDYSESVFTYDLTRLRQGSLTFDGRRFEFGHSRDVGNTLVLRDQNGREERLSSLTIYDKGR